MQQTYRGLCLLPVLADSIVVFDEVHSYDVGMFDALKKFLDRFDLPALCMTASLPAPRRKQLEELGLRLFKGEDLGDLEQLAGLRRYAVNRLDSAIEAEAIARQAVAGDKCVLWVVNTVDRCQELTEKLSSQEIFQNPAQYREAAKEHAQLQDILRVYERYQKIQQDLEDSRELFLSETDEEMKELAKQDVEGLETELTETEKKLKILLLPKDPNDEKNILLEIRAGTGGEEAALFASDLFRMYCRYAETQRWNVETMASHSTGLGGFKEIIALIQGNLVYSKLKYEAGVHRVQRILDDFRAGRRHRTRRLRGPQHRAAGCRDSARCP